MKLWKSFGEIDPGFVEIVIFCYIRTARILIALCLNNHTGSHEKVEKHTV